jgi:glycosyltransferase involved in cell wall biosynthesis
VVVLGRVTAGGLETLYRGAACCLLPSRAEGFGFPALEAMARGIPVAVANAGSLPEVTAGGAVTFDPYDPSDLAAKVEQLMDPSGRASLIANGRDVAARYRWSVAADAVWTIIREAARPTAGSTGASHR